MSKKKKLKKKITKNPSELYGASSITVLKGLEPVRKRPAMYIGGTSIEGLHHLIWEVVDNSIDEAMAGYCKNIEVILHKGNKVTVTDDGRGIPVETHKATKKSTLETVMTILHAGGKFGDGGYKVSGGLHGVGVSVVNALSTLVRVEVKREGYLWSQEYKRGKPSTKLKREKKAKGTGTAVTFDPDPEIFPKIEFDWKTVVTHLRQQAYLTKGVKITIIDERKGHELAPKIPRVLTFYFEGGILSYVKFLNRGQKVVHENPFYVEKAKGDCLVEVAMQYTEEITGIEMTFANNIYTPEGGTHLMGFRTAITRVINDYARKNGYLKEKDNNLTGDDVREGLTAVVSLKLPNPQFEGQTKAKLGNSEVRPIVSSVVSEYLAAFLEEHPQDGRQIMAKTLLACKARLAAKAAKDTVIRKGIMEGLTLPGKLADCSSRNPEESELYIVEGDSAGGCFDGNTKISLADGRNISLKKLVKENKEGKENFCYTIQNNGHIGIAPILNPRITKKNAEVIKIILDNNEELICTPDHLFMLHDKTYQKAKELTSKTLLMQRKGHNHKIVKIEQLNGEMDVYDFEVPNSHNFALSSGIFVHNSAKQGRDRNFQAILPLRGKILNVERARIDKMLSSKEIKALIIAMGMGVGEEKEIDRMRYHRIIIMTDADVDGAHIRTLLLTFFYRYYSEIIDKGYLYIAQPPLYRIEKDKKANYAYSDQDKVKILKEINALPAKKTKKSKIEKAGFVVKELKAEGEEVSDEKIAGINIQRYKGLGEMNPDQLWETTMDPTNRVMLKVTVEDAAKADETFDILMGNEVEPRKRFIQTHAANVKNLDI